MMTFLLVDDFNIHVNNQNNSCASEFLTTCESFNMKQNVSSPTHEPGHTPDLAFTLG